MEKYFNISAEKYDDNAHFSVFRPSSLGNPKDNSVMFITPEYMGQWESLLSVNECIVMWPENEVIPDILKGRHVFIRYKDPRYGFAEFFYENGVSYNQKPKEYNVVGGAFLCTGCKIKEGTIVFPGAYIDADVSIGSNCYIASGVRIMGRVAIGNGCIIRENTVIGSDGLTTRRNSKGKVITIPQFGGVIIEDNVQIGANSVICKGAIDNTIIHAGSRIDNCCFISHNVEIGEDTLIVGETLMMGSSSTGNKAYISGNAVIRDGIKIGEDSFVGMGSVVTKNIKAGSVALGNPAREKV